VQGEQDLDCVSQAKKLTERGSAAGENPRNREILTLPFSGLRMETADEPGFSLLLLNFTIFSLTFTFIHSTIETPEAIRSSQLQPACQNSTATAFHPCFTRF